MKKNFRQLLEEKKVLVADGAWGTEITKNQQIKFAFPEILNLTHPEIIEKLAASYVEAGADIILTNTFGANILKLKKYGADDRINEINKKGVEISLRAAVNKIVFASMGPTGELLEPYGNITEKEMINCFEQQAEILIKSGADGIVIETMSDIKEALCALKAVKNVTDRTVVVCMTFNKTVNGYR
ncbi:MAG: homocysteine S-methyltransferase family protein, partial [Candidatus Ratteibacteria bacterium]